MTETENPGWRADPSGMHQERYFNARGEPTGLVRNDGFESQADLPTDDGSSKTVATQSPEDPADGAASTSLLAIGPEGQELEPDDPKSVAHYVATSSGPATLPVPLDAAVPAVAAQPSVRKRRRNRLEYVVAALVVLLLIGTGLIALQQHSTANKWMNDDHQEVQKNTALSSHVSSLNGQVSNLNGQVSSLQTQLSSVASQKAKALDQNAVLTSALNDASTVANDLNTCVNDTQVVLTDISDSLSSGFVSSALESDATTSGQVCQQAQSEESALQGVLAGA